VYQYAYVNLSGTRAEDNETGLLAPRNPDAMGSGSFRVGNGVPRGEFCAVATALGVGLGLLGPGGGRAGRSTAAAGPCRSGGCLHGVVYVGSYSSSTLYSR
jgi:hypothetical protein